jgi:hypothetical protein
MTATFSRMLLLSSLTLACFSIGCFQTFRTERVGDDCRFRGVPAMMHKPHIAYVTWSAKGPDGQNVVTQHVCSLPVMYAVDVQPAPFGKTDANFKLYQDGQLQEADAKVDQKIPELIKSIGDATKSIGDVAGRGASTLTFIPSLDNTAGNNKLFEKYGDVINIQFVELDQSKGCNTRCAR